MNDTPAAGPLVRAKESTRRFRPYNQDSGFISDPSDGAQVNKFLQNSGRKSVKTKLLQFVQMATIFAVSISAFAIYTYAQTPSGGSRTTTEVKPTVYVPANAPPAPVAKEKEMTCGGYMAVDPPEVSMEIVGGEQEQEQHQFSQGNNLYISGGHQQGLRTGQELSVIRPRGQFKSAWSRKEKLGVYTMEIGRLKVIEVGESTSVVLVQRSCEAMLLGDLVVPISERTAPIVQLPERLDHFANPTGKQNGRIVLARGGVEMPTVNDVVFIDLGKEDNLREGDILTIYRANDTPRFVTKHEEEISRNSTRPFESDKFKGGQFSIDASRTKNQSASTIHTESATTSYIKNRRPAVPRKVVGEMVVTNVQQRTASAVITRVTQEVHTGDSVETQ
jgi:hypothetical protein